MNRTYFFFGFEKISYCLWYLFGYIASKSCNAFSIDTKIQVIAPYKTAAHEHAWYSRNCDVGKARIIVFYYSAHTYVVSLSTKLQKRQTSYKEKIKIPNIENILAIIFPLPHVQTFSLILLVTHIQIHIFTFISSLKSYQFLWCNAHPIF